jgi:hypothetical protein
MFMSTRQSQLLGLVIAALALCLVLAYVGQWAYTTFAPKPTPIPPTATPGPTPTPTPLGPLTINYYVAPSAEDYFRQAAQSYNATKPSVSGRPVQVAVFPVDSISAWRKFESETMTPLPHAWVPESRVFPLLVNETLGAKRGKDVFFEGGQYRIQPTLLSVPVFVYFNSRYQVLQSKFGADNLGWRAVFTATSASSWQALGGPASYGIFRWIEGNPLKDPVAVYGIQNAAGAYFARPAVGPDDLDNAGFKSFMKTILASSANLGLGSYGLDDLRLFRYSFGDGGVFMEKDVLDHLTEASKWDDPLRVVYPEYVSWLDYPVAIWMGDEFSADEKNAALDFSRYVRSKPMQELAVQMGFRPVNEEVIASQVAQSPFLRWGSVGVAADITRLQGMRFLNRDVLDAILNFYRQDILGQK